MLQLNQRKYDDKREFEYELPSFLASKGKCWLKIQIKPFEDSAEAMRQAGERVLNKSRVSQALLDKWRTTRLQNVKDDNDIDDPKVVAIYDELAKRQDRAVAKAQRELAMATYDSCFDAWDSNIWNADTKTTVEPTREMFEQLVGFAYPDDGLSRYGELANAITGMVRDISSLAIVDDEVSEEIAGDDEKN